MINLSRITCLSIKFVIIFYYIFLGDNNGRFNELRESIDEIDSEIVRLYKERMDISKHVAEYKITTGKKVFDKTREDEKLEKLSSLADDEF